MTLAGTVLESVATRGDLAHLAPLLWAAAASFLCVSVLRDLAAANKRFDEFVRELARFNRRYGDDHDLHPEPDRPRKSGAR